MRKICDVLLILLLDPESRVNVAGAGGRSHHAPVQAVQILPGQLLAAVDLSCCSTSCLRRACHDEGSVIGNLLVHCLCGLVLVPDLRVVVIDGKAVSCGGAKHLSPVIIEHIGAARDEADVNGAGLQALAYCLEAGAHGNVDILDVIAKLSHLGLDHGLQGLCGGHDL